MCRWRDADLSHTSCSSGGSRRKQVVMSYGQGLLRHDSSRLQLVSDQADLSSQSAAVMRVPLVFAALLIAVVLAGKKAPATPVWPDQARSLDPLRSPSTLLSRLGAFFPADAVSRSTTSTALSISRTSTSPSRPRSTTMQPTTVSALSTTRAWTPSSTASMRTCACLPLVLHYLRSTRHPPPCSDEGKLIAANEAPQDLRDCPSRSGDDLLC